MSILIDSTIRARFGEIFPDGGELAKIQAAKYYLTLGETLLFLPGGDEYTAGRSRVAPFSLSPGQSATVSTKERVRIPLDLAGIIGPRYENSERGLLFFGGMIVDPGYGWRGHDENEPPDGEPLFITIANLGSRPIELRPGRDPIASIAFLTLEESVSEEELTNYRVVRPAVIRERELPAGASWTPSSRPLGFVEELDQVKVNLDKVSTSTNQVVLFGVIVLSVTLCAAVVGATFAVGGHAELKESVTRCLGLTFGLMFAAVILASGLFYLWICLVALKKDADYKRKIP